MNTNKVLSIALILPLLLSAIPAFPVHASTPPVLSFSPASQTEVGPPATVSVNVVLTGQADLQLYSFALFYSQSVIQASNIMLGSDVPAPPTAIIFDQSINNGAGFLTYGVALGGTTLDATTAKILATVSFKVVGFDTSFLRFGAVTLMILVAGQPTPVPSVSTTEGSIIGPPKPPATSAVLINFKTRVDHLHLDKITGPVNRFFADVVSSGPNPAFVQVTFIVLSAGGNSTTAIARGQVSPGGESILVVQWIAGPEPTRYFVTGTLFFSGAVDASGNLLGPIKSNSDTLTFTVSTNLA